jgi:sec-independent protein translocase protein TatB
LPVFLDLNFTKLLVLGVIALLVFGPDRLPSIAAQAGRALRELRRMAEGAKSELQDNLGPEFTNFDIADLNPKHFVRKHLADEFAGDGMLLGKIAGNGAPANGSPANGTAANGTAAYDGGSANAPHAGPSMARITLAAGERPPYDAEAT